MFPAYDVDYDTVKKASRKGETLTQLYERVAETVRGVVQRCDAEGHRAIVLCTHAAVVIALGRILTGQIPETPDVDDFGAYTCGLSTYRRKEGEDAVGAWTCELNSDCSFLSNGAERGW